MQGKMVPLVLSTDIYRRLEEAGAAEERDPVQQARWILKRALEDTSDLGATNRRPRGLSGA